MFTELEAELEERGARVTRVLFNAGDALFSERRPSTYRFTGEEADWQAWLDAFAVRDRPDVVIGFGCKRPAHRIAGQWCEEAGIPCLALEEGYLRSGYVTCELGGNNDLSPIAGKLPAAEVADVGPGHVATTNFKTMNWLGFLYFTTRIIFSKKSDGWSFHRPLKGALTEAMRWLRNIWRLWSKGMTEAKAVEDFLKGGRGRYILVPLQVPADSQLGRAARGWTLEKLVEEMLTRFASADGLDHLLFKIHPLDEGGYARARAIGEAAARHGLSDRVTVLHTGSIAQLAIASEGMVTINSTSGLSAIHHGTPLLVLGDAVFRHPDLCVTGTGADDIDRFLAGPRTSAPLEVRRNYERFVAREALVPGDFYLPSGRAQAADIIADRALTLAATRAPIPSA
ncbi:capsular polysaccharide export protein, LipB/KpsS family [Sphingomicrobium aestuariivivum]|uniref:capsular polysaccharide export protein, LipB/KpsS family n=1 Tax=Sphingomicrobium aestuariivivum TaxID=1582356 RepID=UPI001FD63A68|nr:hypothetical protein [Sphingomicrobium aestuariivivum]MCJ8191582.1 hypothetical protein [Sphingomicrobium aestuariivivum]